MLGNRTASQNGDTDLNDGGPTSWQAVIQTADESQSYREFLLEFQDTTLMYRPFENIAAPACPQGVSAASVPTTTIKSASRMRPPTFTTKSVPGRESPISRKRHRPAAHCCSRAAVFIAGIPSRNSLFFTDGTPDSNIWA